MKDICPTCGRVKHEKKSLLDMNVVIKMREEKKSYTQIGRKFNVSGQAVYAAVKRLSQPIHKS